jgi:hypothetical protein
MGWKRAMGADLGRGGPRLCLLLSLQGVSGCTGKNAFWMRELHFGWACLLAWAPLSIRWGNRMEGLNAATLRTQQPRETKSEDHRGGWQGSDERSELGKVDKASDPTYWRAASRNGQVRMRGRQAGWAGNVWAAPGPGTNAPQQRRGEKRSRCGISSLESLLALHMGCHCHWITPRETCNAG